MISSVSSVATSNVSTSTTPPANNVQPSASVFSNSTETTGSVASAGSSFSCIA